MLLRRLKEYADERLVLPPRLYSETPIRYIIEVEADGSLHSPVPTDTADSGNLATRRGRRFAAPQVQRAVGIKPLLLADNGEYTLGLARETSRLERVLACHDAYMAQLARCAKATRDPAVTAVLTFLSGEPASKLELPLDFDRGATITFRVHSGLDAVLPINVAAVQAFWAAENDPGAKSAPVMQCLVCGETRPVLDRLQGKIKGVPGGQTSGTSIISANAEAFESYGLEASLIAPTCAECGERFTKGANDLLASQSSRIVLGGSAFIFWTRERVDFSFRDFLNDPQAQQVRDLIRSVHTGGGASDLKETAFYATVLSGSGGRTVVRDWIDTTVGEVCRHLARWFEAQKIVDWDGSEGRPLGLYPLAAATVRDARTDLAPPTPRAMLRAALLGGPLPDGLLYQAVRRNRAEQRVTRPRAALIKLVLRSQRSDEEEDRMVQLDVNNENPAYHCGRLLAVLEQIQRAALGDINQTIVDRFYGTASSAPLSVFSRLVKGAQPHLAKLRRDKRPTYYALDQRLQEIMERLRTFPTVLTLPGQGLFALGYYHQRAYDRAQAREAAERRKTGAIAREATPADDLQGLEEEV